MFEFHMMDEDFDIDLKGDVDVFSGGLLSTFRH